MSAGQELLDIAREMRERRVNHGRHTSPTLEAWADRIEAIARPMVQRDVARGVWEHNKRLQLARRVVQNDCWYRMNRVLRRRAIELFRRWRPFAAFRMWRAVESWDANMRRRTQQLEDEYQALYAPPAGLLDALLAPRFG